MDTIYARQGKTNQLKVITTEVKEEIVDIKDLLLRRDELTNQLNLLNIQISKNETLITEAKKAGIE